MSNEEAPKTGETQTSAQSSTTTTGAASTPKADAVPDWLPDRLERAKQSAVADALKVLGVASLDDARAAIEAARRAEDEKKTEAQKAAEKIAALEPKAQAAEKYLATLERYVDAELSKLSEPQRAAVEKLAAGDKARMLDAIELLRPTWTPVTASTGAPAAGTPSPAVSPKPVANTAPPPDAPAGASTSPVNHTAEWNRLRSVNPFAAAAYLKQHRADIERESQSKQT